MTAAITACPAFSQAYETAAGTNTVQQVRALGAAAEADVIAARRLFHRFPRNVGQRGKHAAAAEQTAF